MQNFVMVSEHGANEQGADVQILEVLEGWAFNTYDFANACGVSIDWVHARVNDGVLNILQANGAGWRFDCASVVRARRIVHLEHTFEADPQLAALTTDLIEEVVRLRLQIDALTTRA